MEIQTHINITAGDLSIDDAPALFDVEFEQADRAVGFSGGYWATLMHIPFGGTAITREQLLLAIGVKALVKLEEDVSDRINDDPYDYLPEAA